MEPIGKLSYIELNYAYHNAHTTSDKLTDTLTDAGISNRYDLLSNDYKFNFISNRIGLNYRYIDKKFNYTLGIAALPTILNGESSVSTPTRMSNFYFAPV